MFTIQERKDIKLKIRKHSFGEKNISVRYVNYNYLVSSLQWAIFLVNAAIKNETFASSPLFYKFEASRTQWQRCVGEEVVTDAYLNLVYKSIYLVLLRYHCIFSLFTPFSLYSNFLFKKTDVNWAKRMLSSQYRHFQLKSWRPRNSIRSIPEAFFVILLYFQNDRRSKPFSRKARVFLQ